MALKLIAAPGEYPVTLEETKLHLRVDHDDDDDLIAIFLRAATANAEKFLGRALVEQTWELTLDEFPDNEIKIPLPPLIEVESVKYDDGDGVEQTVSTDDYTVDALSQPGWILPDGDWPSTFDGINAVRIRFTAGYIDDSVSPAVAAVPSDIKSAILLNVGALYANRESVVVGQSAAQLPWAANELLRPHRVEISMA